FDDQDQAWFLERRELDREDGPTAGQVGQAAFPGGPQRIRDLVNHRLEIPEWWGRVELLRVGDERVEASHVVGGGAIDERRRVARLGGEDGVGGDPAGEVVGRVGGPGRCPGPDDGDDQGEADGLEHVRSTSVSRLYSSEPAHLQALLSRAL